MGHMSLARHESPVISVIDPSIPDLLRELPLFRGMDKAVVARIAAGASEMSARGRSVIFARGDACRGLYFVASGQVKLALEAAQGAEQVVELVGPGGTFGESSLFLGCPRVLTAETLTDTRLICVSKAVLLAELERTSELGRGIIAILSGRLQSVIAALEDCTLRSGTERVVGYLLNQLPPEVVNGRAMVTLPAQKGVIASQLNLTQEHFSRILRALATAAMIEVDGRAVRIRDVDELRAYCPQA
jgi:CRP-like cAMP-binding protein